jgi:hypothetical protein
MQMIIVFKAFTSINPEAFFYTVAVMIADLSSPNNDNTLNILFVQKV